MERNCPGCAPGGALGRMGAILPPAATWECPGPDIPIDALLVRGCSREIRGLLELFFDRKEQLKL